MVGVGAVGPPPVPPVVIDPGPVKLTVPPAKGLPETVGVSVGNDPVAPEYGPVPPVIVADPVAVVEVPSTRDVGIVRVPVRLPSESAIVKGALIEADDKRLA